jgi:hypothetical protein
MLIFLFAGTAVGNQMHHADIFRRSYTGDEIAWYA